MEGAESRSPTQLEDSQISPESSIILADTTDQEFQESVEDILEEIEQDEKFSEMTAENYDKKKSYLKKHLTELSRMHRTLANQHVRLIEEVSKNCPSLIKKQHLDSSDLSSPQVIQKSSPLELKTPIDFDFVFVASGSGFNASKSESLKSFSSLSSDSDSESTNKLLSSPVKDSALEVKNTKALELLLQKNYFVVDEPVNDKKFPEYETSKLKPKFQGNESETATENSHLELQKQVADLKLAKSESDLKVKTMEEELEKYRKSLSIAKDTISNLKGENTSKVFQQNQMMRYELRSGQKLVGEARTQLRAQLEKYRRLEGRVDSCAAEMTVRDDEIKKLNTKNYQYQSEILKLEETLKSKEDIWYKDVTKLKTELRTKSKSFDDLKKRLNNVRSDRNRISGKLETLEEEKCSLETRLNALQVEHKRVLLSLEGQVERQREVISVITEEKMEAIRQLSFSLEHYKFKYEQLRQSFAANKTGCFGFLSFMKP